MAPSTATPTDLHRAPIACLLCRKAKVRCLFSRRRDRCDRCQSNDTECVVPQAKRSRGRTQPYPSRTRRHDRHSATEPASTPPYTDRQPSGQPAYAVESLPQERPEPQQPIVTHEVRARIIAALATLKGKRGAPFSFVTSGDSPAFSTKTGVSERPTTDIEGQASGEQSHRDPVSLKLSWLLRPLTTEARRGTGDDDRLPPSAVKMPTYLSSMTLGQTITDPIEGGIIGLEASQALFEHFMLHMNAKWEYILDPHIDTHDNIHRQSSLLFVSILFCSSKFVNYNQGRIVSETDPFLQCRLCSLARNLVIKNLAAGDRSIETMQALYLLVCWKDPEDDVSYLHTGYAFSVLRDLDLDSGDEDGRQVARRRRTWLALFRQDRQQNLFFMRRAPLNQGDEAVSFLVDACTWTKMPYTVPGDFVACCSADLRRIQSKIRNLVSKSSSPILSCLLDVMNEDLNGWRCKWSDRLRPGVRTQFHINQSLDPDLIYPGGSHLEALVDVWEYSVRLNVASAIFRKALLALMTSVHSHRQPGNPSALELDLSSIEHGLPPNLPGLEGSVSGAFGTLNHLMKFPPEDLRRAPDAVLLLAPNAALFLCLLLCLPPTGILGPSFQVTAIELIQNIAQHVQKCVRSPQDSAILHSTYLDSLVDLLGPSRSPETETRWARERAPVQVDRYGADAERSTLQEAQAITDEIGGQGYNLPAADSLFVLSDDISQSLQMQTLANFLDGDPFWGLLPGFEDSAVSL